MVEEKDSPLKKKVEGEFEEKTPNIDKLVKTLIQSFLKSGSNYGAITDIETDINSIYRVVSNYIDREKIDVYALKLDNRILLSKTNEDFDEIYEVVKMKSKLQEKRDVIELWDDPENKILHVIVLPVRKHFPIEYGDIKEKQRIIEKLSLMAWQI
ncbi:MAG: hypothetical protein RMJ07_06715 [Nitrososphaerota archaeon]|nr:hypothetical protein [Candidatus Bathyarchaeota archaeon]MDW8049346.1 hypothetical protein [Nitrososphaerota archaeon]